MVDPNLKIDDPAVRVSQLQSKFRGQLSEAEGYRKEERHAYAIRHLVGALKTLRRIDDIIHERPVRRD